MFIIRNELDLSTPIQKDVEKELPAWYTVPNVNEGDAPMNELQEMTKERLKGNSFMNYNHMELEFLEPDH